MTRCTMPVVYVAGPYRSVTREGVELNIRAATQVGLQCARRGWSPIVPHANTAHLDAIDPTIGDQFWLDSTMALLERCDALVLAPGWAMSQGTKAEVRRANALGIRVFHSVEEMPSAAKWAQDEYARRAEDPSFSGEMPSPSVSAEAERMAEDFALISASGSFGGAELGGGNG